MHIIIVVPSLRGGGAEFVAKSWAQSLSENGHKVVVVQTHPKKNHISDPPPDDFEVINLNGGAFLTRLHSLRSVLRDSRPDAAISLMPYWNLLLICAGLTLKCRPRLIISGRNMVVPLLKVQGLSLRMKHYASKVLYRFADAFVAISHPVAAETIALYRVAQDRVYVVPNPALAKFERHTMVRSSVQRTSDVIDIIVPARLVPQKRPAHAIAIAARVQSLSSKSVRLTFYGRGPLQTELVREADEAGVSVSFAWSERWFEDCPRGVVLLPSVSEGFGNVLVEAAAAGLWSVVSSRCLGSADAVIPNVTAIVTAADDVDDYSQAVLDAVSRGESPDPLSAWLSRFSAEASVAALEQVAIRVITAGETRRPDDAVVK